MATRFVFFDLGNVLVKFDVRRLIRQVAELVDRDIEQVAESIFGNDLHRDLECGRIDLVDYYEGFCRRVDARPDFDRLLHAVNDMFWANDSIVPVLETLARQSFPRGILSNTGPSHWEHCSGTFDYIQAHLPKHHILSYEIGAMKPDAAIYDAAERVAAGAVPGIRREEIFFTDDREDNIEGAQAAGFDAVLYRRTDELVEQLARRGVPVPE
jgi:putative hydrolase of the HAD superfamily